MKKPNPRRLRELIETSEATRHTGLFVDVPAASAISVYRGRLAEIPLDFHELVGTLAPRHVFIIAPKHVTIFRADSVDRIKAVARPVFRLLRHKDRLRVEYPDGGHEFPPAVREEAYKLLDLVLSAK